ncbi:BA75_05082T0 [Komagataella pastoris]|uniref:BA75_05082T0 n=1 Tax=Komagataella pastoris TaxID=4922 RepID=A0A1B2JJ08_PICPA|nr:BA75_05082T0 [Komagataella pastoris]
MLPTPLTEDLDFEKVYEPAEDSFLLLDVFEKEKPWLESYKWSSDVPLVVEIGTGSGVVTTFVNQHIIPQGLFLATDLNPHCCNAVLNTHKSNIGKKGNLQVLQCDLTTPLKRNQVDVLIFNPPYVPSETVPEIADPDSEDWLDIALLGGPTGMDITQKVLDSLYDTLSRNGVAYILFCARNHPQKVMDNFKAKEAQRGNEWEIECVQHRKAGWEVLTVWRFIRR